MPRQRPTLAKILHFFEVLSEVRVLPLSVDLPVHVKRLKKRALEESWGQTEIRKDLASSGNVSIEPAITPITISPLTSSDFTGSSGPASRRDMQVDRSAASSVAKSGSKSGSSPHSGASHAVLLPHVSGHLSMTGASMSNPLLIPTTIIAQPHPSNRLMSDVSPQSGSSAFHAPHMPDRPIGPHNVASSSGLVSSDSVAIRYVTRSTRRRADDSINAQPASTLKAMLGRGSDGDKAQSVSPHHSASGIANTTPSSVDFEQTS